MHANDTITTETATPAEAIAKAAVKSHRLATAAAEIDFARKMIRQVSLSRWTLLQSGMSEEAVDALLSSLSNLENMISDAAYAANRASIDSQNAMRDLADSFSK